MLKKGGGRGNRDDTDNSQKKRNIKDPQTHEAKYKFTENERDTNPNNKMNF